MSNNIWNTLEVLPLLLPFVVLIGVIAVLLYFVCTGEE